MPTITLREHDNAKVSFALDLGTEVVRLVNPQGNVVAMFTRVEAASRIVLPGSVKGQSAIVVKVDSTTIVRLNPSGNSVPELKRYLGGSPAVEESEAPAPKSEVKPTPARKLALRDIGLGALVTILGLVLLIIAARSERLGWVELVMFFLSVALIVAGVLWTRRGIVEGS